MSKRTGGGAIRIAVAATSTVRRAELESIIRSHAEFHLAGSFGVVANVVSFARSIELDVILVDTDSIRDLLLERASDARDCSAHRGHRGAVDLALIAERGARDSFQRERPGRHSLRHLCRL